MRGEEEDMKGWPLGDAQGCQRKGPEGGTQLVISSRMLLWNCIAYPTPVWERRRRRRRRRRIKGKKEEEEEGKKNNKLVAVEDCRY